jgi:localization factor PodJL
MQPDLPWNVAGIPPEAREAARASARREGLSVGEWLTRRILRGLSDVAAEPVERDTYRTATSRRDTDTMLESVTRSEVETQGAYKRIEEQLRGVGRRLEAAERSQSENSRAMNKAATEINIATREQAQAFDQLGAHVVGLADRLARIEKENAADGLKDAVRGLHQGLSRLAEQISQTANQSADQIAALAGNVESVAGKLIEARGDAETASRALEERIGLIDERVRGVERAAQSSASTLERTLDNIEKTQGDKAVITGEIQRHATHINQVGETLDRLNARFSTTEAQTSGAMARLEETVSRLESQGEDPNLDRRLLGIEHALSDIAGRLENTERSGGGNSSNVEETLRALAQRVDAADKRHRDALMELRSAVKDANGKLATFEPAAEAAPAARGASAFAPQSATQASGPQSAGQPIFDLPPFPDTAPPFQSSFQPQQQAFNPPAPDPFSPLPFDSGLPPHPDHAFGHAQQADTFAAAAEQGDVPPSANESFISAARRSARNASVAVETAPSGFSWGSRRDAPAAAVEEPEEKTGSTRYLLIAGIALIAIVAIIAGVFLSQSLGGRHDVRVPANAGGAFSKQSAVPAAPSASAYTPPLDSGDDTNTPTYPVVSPPPPKPITVKPSHVKAVPDTMPAAQMPMPQQASQPQQPPLPQAEQSPAGKLAALANGGNVRAESALGFAYLDGTSGIAVNEAEGARWLERAANAGDAMAAYRLGTLYERGRGVPTDAAKAIQLYGIAAKQGNRKAMHNLAVAFADGSGVPKNLQQASQWFTKAAQLGLSDSQFNLAVLYERGMGVTQSLTEAYKWYAIAAAQGDSESKARVDAISTQLAPADKAAAQKAADNFQPQPINRAANTAPTPADVLGN